MTWAARGAEQTSKAETRKLLIFPREITTERIVERDMNALVRRLLYPGDTALLYGASGECKSFLGADLGWHLAMGRDWHGWQVKQAPVLYGALEGVDGFQKRLRALIETFGDPGDMFAQLAIPVSLATGEAGEAGLKLLLAAAKQLEAAAGMPPGLLVIDTMARALAGDDENAAKETMHFLEKRVGLIARKTGAAVMVVHHENKAGDIRGSSALKAGCDLVLHSDNRVLTVEKAKDDAAVSLFSFELDEVQVATAYDGKPLMSSTIRTRPAPSQQFSGRNKGPRPRTVPKTERVLRIAFEKVENDGRASMTDVRAEFMKVYPTGEAGETATQTRGKAFRRAVTETLPVDLKAEIVDGAEFLVRSADPLDIHEAKTTG